jgi:Integrase core domain
VLSIEEEAIIVDFRKHTLLPLDDCLYALQPTIPRLSRSSLHRCLQRHEISRLPEVVGDNPTKKKFKSYPIGFFHIDIAEVQTAEGKLRLFVAIDRTSKFAYAELHQDAGKMVAAQFLRNLIAAVPYTIHTVLTDNGIQFANRARDKYAFHHIFDRVCAENGIEHRLTKLNHPWTNGQVERMNRTIKEATVKRFHYDNHNQLRRLFTRRRAEVTTETTSTGGGTFASADTRFQTSLGGVQFGLDGGLYNINAPGLNAHLGITGGSTWGYSSEKNGSRDPNAPLNVSGSAAMLFYGVYAAVTGQGFSGTVQWRHNTFDMQLNNPDLGPRHPGDSSCALVIL